ncbi:serine hydrolase domain-containing protein [uncultured Sphingosinicella sp.]|uniref:serine hydrolase domain-containing protein n=1 Tax=uncultured Sphingosinicella sp. TaxID=478748 RepID=UPI0030DA21CF|tara:strand:+ start:38694 stop:40274 length:1581 start_codon:yes stop_codon:yes gene_type:complete
MKTIATAFLVSVTAFPALAQPNDGIDAVFARYTGESVPGCAVGVEKDGKTVLERAYGMADIEERVRAQPSSIYEAGSISKQFTAAAIVLLARDGTLALSDDIRKYLPEMPDYGTPITIEHLIQHTSGLRDWGSISAMEGWPRNSRSANNDDVLAIAARQKGLNYAPGAHYSYSNTNFNLAAIIVARVSGQSFAAFTKARIFDPLGMTSTQWRERYRTLVPGRATAYAREGDTYVIDQPIEDAHGNGGLLTTVKDLLAWNAALDADRLGVGFRAAMERVGVLTDGTRIVYASGLLVDKHRGIDEVAHSGATGGYRAWLARYPAQRLSIALLCNAGDVEPVAIGHSVADHYLSGLAPMPVYKPSGKLPAGLYVSEVTGAPISIVADAEGGLRIDGKALDPVAPGRWSLSGTDFVFGRRNDLVVEANGERLRYRRVEPVEMVDPTPFAGRYCGADNPFCMVVRAAPDGGLSIATTGRPGLAAQPLKPAFTDVFTSKYATIRFVRDASGAVSGLTYGDSRAWAVEFTRTP